MLWVRQLQLIVLCVLWTMASCSGKNIATAIAGAKLPSEGVSLSSAAVDTLQKQNEDQLASRCPMPSKEVHATCREITYEELPSGAKALLRQLKCDTGPDSTYNYGTAVDLNGDGVPEYQFCCNEAAHGPCSAVLIGKIQGEWKDLTAKNGMLGFEGRCNLLVVLASQHNGFHDLCLPAECGPSSKAGTCDPAIWRYDGTRYKVANAPVPATPK